MKARLNKTSVNLPIGADKIYETKWNLDNAERAPLVEHFLRSWSAAELAEHLSFSEELGVYIDIWGTHYQPRFTGPKKTWDQLVYLAVRGREFVDPINNKQPMYWLSFRAGYVDGVKFAYVIVQEDSKEGNGHGK
jgi:hypothetical protein